MGVLEGKKLNCLISLNNKKLANSVLKCLEIRKGQYIKGQKASIIQKDEQKCMRLHEKT